MVAQTKIRIKKQPAGGRYRFIDPAVLMRIRNLPLVAKMVVEGFVSGMHRSPYHGFSLDFAEYRSYSPGDDIRSVDWKVFARSDRFFVKKYEGDTNSQVYILLDSSKSMAFSSHAISKHDYGRFLAASLAYLVRRQKDAIGLLTFDSGIQNYTPARTRHGHYHLILSHLDKAQPDQQTDISAAMKELARLTRKRSIVILISDFYQELESISNALRFFHHRGNDLLLFHLLDPAELELPFSTVSTLEDMETGDHLTLMPESREAYLGQLKEHIRRLRKECSDSNIDYELINTEDPLDRALQRYLTARSRKY